LTGPELATRCSPVKREAGDWIERVWNMRDSVSSALKWYENEYVVDAATTFILLANAAESISH
jgi:hypothetical protein